MKVVLKYLKNTVDNNAVIEEWDAKKQFNMHITASYQFYKVRLLDIEFIVIKPEIEIPINTLQIQMVQIQKKVNMPVVVMKETLTRFAKKKLIEKRIPFLIMDKQMYLPFLGMDLNMQVKQEKEVRSKFSPTTQLIYLYLLYQKEENITLEEIANILGISIMTASRGFSILKQLNLVRCEIGGKTGRKKVYYRISKDQYYQNGKEYLINPVIKNVYYKSIPRGIGLLKSGEYALAEDTMLNIPIHPIYAISKEAFLKIDEKEVFNEVAIEETDIVEVQVMNYAVERLGLKDKVDVITMILSLKEKDERTEIAISERMEGFEWYMD